MNKKCIIIGGGIIGMMSALELSNRNWDVVILEKGECGKESSWAGGGIVSPMYPWNEESAVNDLAFVGQQVYPELSVEITRHTGIDPECLASGMLYLDAVGDKKALAWLDEHHLKYETRKNDAGHDGLFVPHISQIRSPRIAQGMKRYLMHKNVLMQKNIIIHEQVEITDLQFKDSRFESVIAGDQRYAGDCVVIATGAWSSGILSKYHIHVDIKPIRGQIIAFQTEPNTFSYMMMKQSKYLIPRKDGLVLAGSTVEDVGFEKQTTEDAKQELIKAAFEMCPRLESARITQHWAGLRPGTSRNRPVICKAPNLASVYISAGHFRNGLTLAPGSARFLADLMENKLDSQSAKEYCLSSFDPV